MTEILSVRAVLAKGGGQGAESGDHLPLAVYTVDGMPFVKCSCDIDHRPQSAVWLREHWQGTEDAGVAALRAVVARQAVEQANQ